MSNNKQNSRRRSRGGSNRKNLRSQTFDSNGPDVRIRGTATQVYEKYCALAKDAIGAGDSIMAENYLQHAEHYSRIMNAQMEQMEERREQSNNRNSRNKASENSSDITSEVDNGEASDVIPQKASEGQAAHA